MKPYNRSMRLLPVLAAISLMMACNAASDDTSKKTDSTTTTVTTDNTTVANNPDTTSTTTTATKNNTTVKKKTKGKVSAAFTTDEKIKIEKDNAGVYGRAEVTPAFPGGQPALEDYIQKKIQYPSEAIDNQMEGTVRVEFVVDETGKVTSVKTLGDKIGNGLEEEAIAVVSNMPKWSPGQVKGKNVKTRLTLPITYKLEE